MPKQLLLTCKSTRILLFLILLFNALVSRAQSSHAITGTIVDAETGLPIELASIEISKDSIVLKASATDHKGRFSIQDVVPGKYSANITFIGYQRQLVVFNYRGLKLSLGIIGLSPSSREIKEVKISSRKSILYTSIDRKIYNVSKDIMAGSGSVSDVLKNIPSVEVDIDGNVSLRGSTEVEILIDGKPSPQMGKSRADVLEQMPANVIEKIEVITNPSAKYKPDGTAGIINIVLKKNTSPGFNGTATINVGTKERYNGNVNLNYKYGKINLYGSYAVRRDNRIRMNIIHRQVYDPLGAMTGYYNEWNQSTSQPLSHRAILGTEYTINTHNSISASLNYSYRFMKKLDVINRFYSDPNDNLLTQQDRLRYDPETETERGLAASWQHNFTGEGHNIRFEYSRAIQDEIEDNHFTNKYNFPFTPNTYDNTLIKHYNAEDHLSIDYTKPFAHGAKLELGYEGSFTKQQPVYYGEFFDTTLRNFVEDNMRSNKFIYNQDVNAVYTTFQYTHKKFGYLAGLRMEETGINANLLTKDSLVTNSFFKIYPTLHLGYTLPNGEVQLNYSRRVNRPEADDVNPFPEYRDPRNLRVGNPRLLPEIINSFELGYKYQHEKLSFVPSIYYRYKQNAFTEVISELNDSTLLTTQENLSNDQSAGLELILSDKPSKYLSANLSANVFYNVIDGSALGFNTKKSIISMSATFNSNVAITPTTVFQISSNYRSARLTPQGKLYASFVFNSGLRQEFFKKKLSVTLTGSDLLKTYSQKALINTSFLSQTIISKRDSQVFYLGLTYHFGKATKKINEEKLQYDNSP